MDIHSEDCRRHLRLSRWTWAINFPQRQIWCIDYCSLSLLNHTSYHLLQQYIVCLATLRNQTNCEWFKHKHQYTKSITRLSDQSNFVSKPSTPSPISSRLTKAGTHNSSMAQRSWRRSLYLLIICTWGVDGNEFQCHSAGFVISNEDLMRCYLVANLNGCLKGNDYSDEKGVQPPGEEECQMGSAMWKSGVHGRWWTSAEWKEATNPGRGAPTGIEERTY